MSTLIRQLLKSNTMTTLELLELRDSLDRLSTSNFRLGELREQVHALRRFVDAKLQERLK